MSSEKSDQIDSSVYLLAALIGGIAVVIAALIGNEVVTERVLEKLEFKEDERIILADRSYSGSAFSHRGNDMLTFAESESIYAAGDTSDDQFVKSYLTFILADIPSNAEILEARIDFSCNILGNPETHGKLTLQEFDYGEFEKEEFHKIPSDTWKGIWSATVQAIDSCRQGRPIFIAQDSLAALVQRKLEDQYAQFVMYFQRDDPAPIWVPNNENADAILLLSPPSLYVRYKYEER